MLYREEWSIPKVMPVVRPDVFSLKSLIQWLEMQPAEKEYDFNDCKGACLLDRYANAMGLRGNLYRYGKLCETFDGGVYGEGPMIACKLPHTFGAALDRARAAQQRGQ
jgi:hypothetical protein